MTLFAMPIFSVSPPACCCARAAPTKAASVDIITTVRRENVPALPVLGRSWLRLPLVILSLLFPLLLPELRSQRPRLCLLNTHKCDRERFFHCTPCASHHGAAARAPHDRRCR